MGKRFSMHQFEGGERYEEKSFMAALVTTSMTTAFSGHGGMAEDPSGWRWQRDDETTTFVTNRLGIIFPVGQSD